jgi:DNA (cytosine-5)-methyltransferase 1
MLRAIREIQPSWVVGENVLGLVNWNGGLVFHEVQTDLEAEGYTVQPCIIPACAVNAPHRRERIWFVAYANKCATGPSRTSGATEGNGSGNDIQSEERRGTPELNTGLHELSRDVADTSNEGLQRCKINGSVRRSEKESNQFFTGCLPSTWQNFPTQPPICGGNDGLPTELDGITFPKWRNESIKAYGNAVVPQVVYEIFKAINQYHTQ